MEEKKSKWFDQHYARLMHIADMGAGAYAGLALQEIKEEFYKKFKKETTPFLILWSQYLDTKENK